MQIKNVGNCAACNILFDLFTTLRHLGLGSAGFGFALTLEPWSSYPTAVLSWYSLPSFENTTGIFDPVALLAGAIENPEIL